MSTRGRRTRAIARSLELINLVNEESGHPQAFYRDQTDWTVGEFATALKYALQDKQIKQVGNRRSATLHSIEVNTDHIDIVEDVEVKEYDNKVRIEMPDAKCSYCGINNPEDLSWKTDSDGNVEMHKDVRYALGIRQMFHLCKRCYVHRFPKGASFHNDTEGLYEWNGTASLGEQKVMQFKEWKIYTVEGTRCLVALIEPLDSEGNQIGADRVWIRFSFPIEDDKVRTNFARGYRYLHRMFVTPDDLMGKTVVVSRERNKGGKGWFWSWTPYPRIPLGVLRTQIAETDAEGTMAIEMPPDDVSVPEHHIHAIMDDGEFTIIKVRKNITNSSDDKYRELKAVVQSFLTGDASLLDLEDAIEETESEEI